MAVRTLTPDLQKTAIEELNEVPERVQADIEALRTWIEQQPHLTARTDDQFLVTYLRGCKYSLEKAKSKIDKFYTLRTKYPELFLAHNIDVDAQLEIFRQGAICYLPTPLHGNGPRIGIFRLGSIDLDKYSFIDMARAAQLMSTIVMLEDDYAIINGVVHIMDLERAGASFFLQMPPSVAKKFTVYQEEALPIRQKAAHFINVPMGFDKVFNIFKPMMSEKQQKRMFVHGSKWHTIFEQISQKYLPIEYGGENGSIPEIIKYWEKRILAYRDYFAEENNYGTNENLRPGKPFDFESIFGLEGSFRKIDVD